MDTVEKMTVHLWEGFSTEKCQELINLASGKVGEDLGSVLMGSEMRKRFGKKGDLVGIDLELIRVDKKLAQQVVFIRKD